MAISTQIQNLNLIPGKSAPVVVHLSQGNVGNTVQFYLYDGDNPYYPPTNVSIAVHGVRSDGSVFGPYAVSVTSGSNIVSFNIVAAMTSVNGAAIGELVITDSNQNQIGSANFGMLVEATPYSSSVTYEDDLSIYQRILAYVQSISATSTDKIAAETTERKQADSALGTRIDNEAAARQNGDNNLQAQINQIVAPSGEAPSAAEVENARIDVDGVTHDTLGDAIRGQVNALKTSNDGAFITSQVRVSGTLTHISYTDKTKLPGTVGYNIGWVFDVTNASRISFHTKSKRYYNIYTFTDSSGNALTYQKEATADTAYDLDLAVPSGATSIYITTGDGSALDNVTDVILYKKTNITKVANDGFANLELKPTFTSTFCTGTSMPTSSDHIHIQSGRYDVSDESVVYVKMKSQKLYNIYTFTDANNNFLSYEQEKVGDDIEHELVLTVPNNAKWLYISGWERYQSYVVLSMTKKDGALTNFKGKKIVWLGTSIPAAGYYNTTNENSYPRKVGRLLGATVYNEAVGSSPIHCRHKTEITSNNPYGFGTDFESTSRCLSNTVEEMNWIISHYNSGVFTSTVPSSMTDDLAASIRACSYEQKIDKYFNNGEKIDMWVIDHGHNDWPYASEESEYDTDKFSVFTYKGACNFIINHIRQKDPFAKIVMIGEYEDSRQPYLKECQSVVADFWDIPLMDSWNRYGINERTITTTGYWEDGIWKTGGSSQEISYRFLYLPDGVHPHSDRTGRMISLMAHSIAEWIKLMGID